jgi:hypothetical protein
MKWYHYIAYFFGGAFLVNSVPHFTNGVSGRSFPSPFASPCGLRVDRAALKRMLTSAMLLLSSAFAPAPEWSPKAM